MGIIYSQGIGYGTTRENEKLPTANAWCKYCARESAKPIAFIKFNGENGIMLRCIKCNTDYPMYEGMYNMRYIGTKTKHGMIAPTHGRSNPLRSASRDIQDKLDIERQHRRKESDERLQQIFHQTPEEFAEMKKQWAIADKRAQQSIEAMYSDIKDREREDKAAERKKLIEEGVLVYKKHVGLVDTRTNTVVKL